MPKSQRSHLLALAALSVELTGAEAPVDFRILPAGEFRSWDGRPTECPAWICTEEDGRRIVAELSAWVGKRVIDYEHATLHAKKTGAKAPAAGWFQSAEWRPDGVWLTGVDWTAQAAQEIVGKEYRYVSPVFSYDKQTGRVGSLFYAALTNDPGLDGLTDLAALAAELFLPPINPQEKSMELLKKLLAVLGLQETATEAEALSAVAALKTNVASLSAQVAEPDPAKFVPVTTLAALQGELATEKGKLAALQAEVDGGKVEALINKGKADGKIPPAMESWARDLGKTNFAALSAFLEKAPPVVKPGETQSGGQGDGKGVAALSAEQQAVCKQLGLSEDEFLKSLPASA
jgi:phage I-like protein